VNVTKKDETAERVAALERELAELKAKVDPPKSTFTPMTDAEHRDWVHQMRERQANSWMPPNAIRDLVEAEPRNFMKDVVRDNRAPTTPGMIPDSQQSTGPRPSAGDGSGWSRSIPIGPSMHQRYVDQQIDAQDAKDRRELVEQKAREQELLKAAERK
jgi:hypothetical protein